LTDWFCPKIFSLPENEWIGLEPDKQEIMHAQVENEKDEMKRGTQLLIDHFSSWNKLVKIARLFLNIKRVKIRSNCE